MSAKLNYCDFAIISETYCVFTDIRQLTSQQRCQNCAYAAFYSGAKMFKKGAVFDIDLFDELTITCPKGGKENTEVFRIFMVSDMAYLNCQLDSSAKLFLECNDPQQDKNRKVVFRPYSPTPEGLEFAAGKSYYLISKFLAVPAKNATIVITIETTSSGTFTGIDQRQNGLCSSHNLRLKIDIHGDVLPSPPSEVSPIPKDSEENLFQISEYSDYISNVVIESTTLHSRFTQSAVIASTQSPLEEAHQRNLDLDNFRYVLSLAQHGAVGSVSFSDDVIASPEDISAKRDLKSISHADHPSKSTFSTEYLAETAINSSSPVGSVTLCLLIIVIFRFC
uniref:Ephrin RBD domain-containing protein n=1 Tax=Steinernema glaseri TaxID=37863 RepID=A0A1I8AF42_9BILA